MKEKITNQSFISKFNHFTRKERKRYYLNKEFIMNIFSLNIENRACLLLFLKCADSEDQKFIFQDYIIPSILSCNPNYKIGSLSNSVGEQ